MQRATSERTRLATDVFYEVAVARLDAQVERISKLDDKIAATFSVTTAILPLFGALLVAAGDDPSDLVAFLYGVGVVVYVYIIALSALAYFGGRYSVRPDLATLAAHSANHDEQTVRNWVAQECVRSIDANTPKLTRKALYVTGAIAGIAVESGLLGLAALLAIL